MPAETPNTPAQTEKPHHYTYLKEFRTQQCPLFLQHKCTQHRPYTCFHWHFMNQRRRRPVKKRDGTFNYSPDVYCTKYDETTGICPDGDDCPLLHRTAGDTERRYHLRYYKTCTCVYETDARGHCVKNGAHCAFAHGAQDLRPPSYDVRELQAMENAERQGSNITDSPLGSSLEKDRIINEDPRWNDTNYVLANYKTEQCKRPPRLCRQGYACPSYHNTRDRRRSPKKFKYRSTPCPNVKHGDDWGDPTQCENADGCAYCHTRTEQQFHPEIYKSTKCNDMVQTGYCPRGPFCAFAHVEQEMTTQRDVGSPNDTSLAAFLKNALHDKGKNNHENENDNSENDNGKDDSKNINMELSANSQNNGDSRITTNGVSLASSLSDINVSTSLCQSFPEPIGKRRTNSMSSSVASENSPSNYHKAPGSEREDCQVIESGAMDPANSITMAKLRHKLQSIENDPQLDTNEKSKRKQNLLLLHSIGSPGMMNTSGSPSSSSSHIGLGTLGTSPSTTAAMSPHAPSFYPAGETVESVIGNALDEDLNLGELSLSSLDREISRDNDNDTNSVCSSLSTGFPATNTPGSESYHYPPAYLGATSVPVTIPSGGYQRNSLGSLSQSPSSSPLQVGSLPLSFMPPNIQQQQQKQEQQIQDAAAAFLSQPNPGKFSAPGYTELNSVSPRNTDSISQSPLLSSSAFGSFEFQRMREELINTKTQRAQWEECIIQARNACEAWKKEAEEANKKAKLAHEECQQAIKQRDEAVAQVAKLKQEVDQIRAATILGAAPFLSGFARSNDMDNSTQACVKQVQKQLKMELDKLDVLCPQLVTQKCCLCQKTDCEVRVLPCNHLSLCSACTSKCNQCPICRTPISQSFVLPM